MASHSVLYPIGRFPDVNRNFVEIAEHVDSDSGWYCGDLLSPIDLMVRDRHPGRCSIARASGPLLVNLGFSRPYPLPICYFCFAW